MHYNHHLGLHLPLNDELEQLVNDAVSYNIKYFQFFLAPSQRKSKNIRPSTEAIAAFIAQKEKFFSQVYIHSSYWINAATGNDFRFEIAKTLLKKEIALAKKLTVPFLVLHPGSATWHKPTEEDPLCKRLGIERVASMLNHLLKKESEVMILLENTAHGNRTIGSDFNDLFEIKKLLDFPDRVGFCVDTAHAFAYGYNLSDDSFMRMIADTIGFDSIKLLHLNDSFEALESKHDRHALPSLGLIGKDILQKLINHEAFKAIPKIIEVTNVSSKLIHQNLADVSTW